MWNRVDLSFDAVVKYFACGFFICTSNTLVYEWLVSKVAQKILSLVDYLGSEGLLLFSDQSEFDLADGEHRHSRTYFQHPLWYDLAIAGLTAFVNAFVVAGITEEMCKYLCFWMVEHPDLEIRNKVALQSSSASCKMKTSEDEDTETTGLLSSKNASLSTPDLEQQIIFAPTAPLVSIGEAITVAMITVALGFASAENLLYIFVYTPADFGAEIDTLYVRCLFPIHPMAAALQSIGVCRRDLEKDASVGVGRIILPALLLHGFFDVSLMAYSAIKKILDRHSTLSNFHAPPTMAPEIVPGEGEAVDTEQGVPLLTYVMGVPFIAMMYFLNESFYQRERLAELDKENLMRRHR